MSARHLKALRISNVGLADGVDAEEAEDADSPVGGCRGGFDVLIGSSDEEDDSIDAGKGHDKNIVEVGRFSHELRPVALLKPKAKRNDASKEEDDEDKWWQIETCARGAERDEKEGVNVSSDKTECSGLRALFIDRKALNLDRELMFRFGQEGLVEGGGGGGGGGPGNRSRARTNFGHSGGALSRMYHRRCFFGGPKEDWQRPPTFVGGGLRLSRVRAPVDCETSSGEEARAWFAFEWSPALQALQHDYRRVQETCNPNALAIFLAQHPHYAEGLLTLALVLAAHGRTAKWESRPLI